MDRREADRDALGTAAQILESITDAFFALDADWRFTYVNHRAEALWGRARADLLGRRVWDEFPQAVGSTFDRQFRRALAGGEAVQFEEFYPPLDAWLDVRVFPSPDGGLSVFFQDVTERRRQQQALRESEERYRLLVEGARDYAIIPTDQAGRITGWNAGAERILGWAEAEAVGLPLDAIFTPEDRAQGVPQQETARAAAEGRSPDIRWHVRRDGTRFWADGALQALRDEAGGLRGYAKILCDATERKALQDEHARFVSLVESSEEFIGLCGLDGVPTYVNPAGLRMAGLDGLGRARRTPLGDFFFPEDRAFVLDGLLPRALRGGRAEAEVRLRRFDTGAAVWVICGVFPLADGAGRPVCLAVVIRDISARKALEDEREGLLAEMAALLAEARARAEREALLNRIGQAIRGALDPLQVLETAVRELGPALGADRCYYAAYDQAMDRAAAGPEWRRPGLPPISGEYPMSRFTVNRSADYRAGRTQVVPDTTSDPAAQALGLCALVRVPLVSGAAMTALSVAMADGPRAWTAADVALVEAVATLTQGALETVRARRREHTIAEQLQAALQPPIPASAPGLALAKYYEAALAEAGVGGDFYDVFALDKGCTVLAVGDLSGKGLAAAAQVATVRNMLRAFLYSQPTLAGALTDLNRVLTVNNLLTGFATLFVGCHDGASGVLAYVNCGQEPALLRRAATGAVEALQPTGPVLGAMEDAAYEEEAVTLRPGDALAVFTDGVTECGLSRREMLGIDGVAALLAPAFLTEDPEEDPEEAPPAQSGGPPDGAARMAEAVALRLIAGVDAASAGGVARDDVCLLVAVAEG